MGVMGVKVLMGFMEFGGTTHFWGPGPYLHCGPTRSTEQLPWTQGRGLGERASQRVMQMMPVSVRYGV